MRRPLLALLVLTACSGEGGAWPSLARRPIEGPPPSAEPRRCAVATGPASCVQAPGAPTVAQGGAGSGGAGMAGAGSVGAGLTGAGPIGTGPSGAGSTGAEATGVGSGGAGPTLVGPAGVQSGGSPAAATVGAGGTLPPTAPVAIDDIAGKLAVIDRDLTDAAARLAVQRSAAVAAAAAARGAGVATPAWAKAELERTALDRIGNQVGDLRERLDAIAGTLAAASVGGTDVAAPLLTTGRLIARATALTGEYEAAVAALQ